MERITMTTNCGVEDVRFKEETKDIGVCGDPADAKNQRHMDGGRYGNRIIGKTYKQGQKITIDVLLTASHLGYFEFRIGDFSDRDTSGDEMGKLNGQLMEQINGDTKFRV